MNDITVFGADINLNDINTSNITMIDDDNYMNDITVSDYDYCKLYTFIISNYRIVKNRYR